MNDANPDDQSTREDYPDTTPEPYRDTITRYASYNYRNYADVTWFPPPEEDRATTINDHDAAKRHAEEHGRLFGSDLMFGGFDMWRQIYGAEYDELQARREPVLPHSIPTDTDNDHQED